MNKAIILANGQFPKRREALQAILQIPLVVCCDGAYNKLLSSQLLSHCSQLPEIHVVGDGDSRVKTQNDDSSPNVVFVDGYTDQETNDLTKAVKYAVSIGVERMIILGACGLREDHTIGNISLLAQYATMTTLSGKPLMVKMYTDYGFFTPLHNIGATTLPSFAGQQVSLFSLSEGLTISVEGLKYPIVKRALRFLWEGTLNEALGDTFSVTLEGEGSLLVYQTHYSK